ncbi:MAG: EVE domain-containing protein [Sandaracinaceae bacterium]
MPRRARRYWLMKSEPGTYSIDDLEREGRTPWDGVRNYQARNYMWHEMAVGDLAFFYHSSAKPPGVAGVCRVCSEPYPDPTQFEPDGPYYEPKASEDDPRWYLVDVEFVERFDEPVGLPVLKAHAAELDGLMVIKKGIRFSVQPVEKGHFRRVLKLAGARTKIR